jgi:hypothetical protein
MIGVAGMRGEAALERIRSPAFILAPVCEVVVPAPAAGGAAIIEWQQRRRPRQEALAGKIPDGRTGLLPGLYDHAAIGLRRLVLGRRTPGLGLSARPPQPADDGKQNNDQERRNRHRLILREMDRPG